jgi:hypothetical protein
MAKIKGVNVIAPVVPFDTTDVHPSHEARYGKGGYRTVATLVERDAIPAPRREAGMLVFVASDGKAYQLGSDLTTWAEFTSGVSSWNDLEDKPTEFQPSTHSHAIADVTDLSDALGEKVPKAGGTMDADATLTFPTAASSSEVGGWGFGVGLNVEGSAPGQYATVEPQAITVVNGSGSTQLTPAGLTLQNATQLVVGSFDNSTGGANGISLICAVGYELNWQGGRLRNVQIGGNGTPQPIFCDSTIEFTGEDGTIAITGDGIIFPDGTQTVAWTGSFSYTALTDLPTLPDQSLNTADGVSFSSVTVGAALSFDNYDAQNPSPYISVQDFSASHQTPQFCFFGVRLGVGAFIQSYDTVRIESYGGNANGALVLGSVLFSGDSSTQTTAWTGTVAWSGVTGTPTTISDYGITDAVSSSDGRLTDARTPTSHDHGNITNAGAIGTTSGQIVVTTTDGVLTTAASIASSAVTGLPTAGTGSSNYCAGDDSRLSNARTPTAHKSSHATGGADALAASDIGAAAASHNHSASDIQSGTLAAARLPIVLEQTQAVGNSGTSTTLALTTGSVQTVTLNGNCTFTMPTATAGASITLILTQSGTFTATFTGVLWAGGTAPTITATANKVDILVFVSNGTSWFGTAAQNF